ncbi:TonB-dependent receptor plug domain-containing protein [Saccharophagus degradans]|uniref:TonB-dependent receptor, plug n=1 Tax=Saccharophagus degradans (strain 2-40 / ATCC 43961 / DSM 17024) TaxID=203122 RepID=Q21DZ1_SACD2|nr:TonB-dependent receptor [Saccharophagus degradans]ABD83088.1 TonB-dependent receptor, plug [Saccharophagus degradans 2-40]
MKKTFHTATLCAASFLILPTGTYAEGQTAADLIEMGIEQLVDMEIEVESAGKNRAKGLDVPYAAFVISAEDIRLSGARNIPEALRMAPGVTADQVGAHEWSVSIRGAGGQFSRFVLVMVNGKSLYNSVFSGVNWNELNYNLADIKQIEVIRGPNAAAWGANAVNGIINIITYSAGEKPSTNVEVWAGEHHRQGVNLRQSGKLNNDWDYAVSGHFGVIAGLENAEFDLQEKDGRDWRVSTQVQRNDDKSNLQIYVEAFGGDIGPIWSNIFTDPVRREYILKSEELIGGSIQVNYQRALDENWRWNVRTALDQTDRQSNFYYWDSRNLQADLELSGTVGIHALSMGVNSRFSYSSINLSSFNQVDYFINFIDENENIASYGAFLSDTISLSDKWQATLSARVDENQISGTSLQPSMRLMWLVSDSQRIWAAASRAASTPSRALTDAKNAPYEIIPANTLGNPLPIVIVISDMRGNRNTVTDALELGYRVTWGNSYIDAALFKNEYKYNISVAPIGEPELYPALPNLPIALIQHAVFDGNEEFESSGYEFNLGSQLSRKWDVQASITKSNIKNYVGWENTLSLRSNYNVTDALTFSAWWMYRSNYETSQAEIEDINTIDLGLRYQHSESTSIALQLKNIGSKDIQAVREAFSSAGMYVGPHGMITLTHEY